MLDMVLNMPLGEDENYFVKSTATSSKSITPPTEISSTIFYRKSNNFDCFFGPDCSPSAGSSPIDVRLAPSRSVFVGGSFSENLLWKASFFPNSCWYCNTFQLQKHVVQ